MPTATTITPQSLLANDLRKSVSRLVGTVRATPAEKLDFKPSETAHSIRELVQHILGGNGYCLNFAGIAPIGNPEATDIEALLADVEASTNALAEYAENADDATLAKEMPFFGGNIGVATFLQTVEWHISRHVAQIDYIQTIYGDLENHD